MGGSVSDIPLHEGNDGRAFCDGGRLAVTICYLKDVAARHTVANVVL